MEYDSSSLEHQLNDFSLSKRQEALDDLLSEAALPEPGPFFNLHCHSFYSYNGYGYSPASLVWKARREGLCGLGLVDFDVLDGVDEFLSACWQAGLKACAGLETRVFVPQFADRVINSPGEPGISYHVGAGFTSASVTSDAEFLVSLKRIAQERTRSMVARINPVLAPVTVDFDYDVLPRTPHGNATERHVCEAYYQKAEELFPDRVTRMAYWAEHLSVAAESISNSLDDAPAFQGLIRTKTMKAGGAGYVRPEGADFPDVSMVNAFIRANGALPSYAFLDGTSDGEQAAEELLDTMVAGGVALITLIPERNWNFKDPAQKALKVGLLHKFLDMVKERHLPLAAGTEMNAHGQRFVDAFDTPELQPYYDDFLAGAHILHAHTVLQSAQGMGYLGEWAEQRFTSLEGKNEFYRQFGQRVSSPDDPCMTDITPEWDPQDILVRCLM